MVILHGGKECEVQGSSNFRDWWKPTSLFIYNVLYVFPNMAAEVKG